jgi:hypothetical protein
MRARAWRTAAPAQLLSPAPCRGRPGFPATRAAPQPPQQTLSPSRARPPKTHPLPSLVVTPLLERITGQQVAGGGGAEGGAEANPAVAEEERRAQREINLGDDVEEAVRWV